MTAAAARAAHLIVDDSPYIFSDTAAEALLGEHAAELVSYHRGHARHPILSAARAQVTCRSRYAEDRLAEAVDRGVRQYVLLGAGLDSFGYRCPLAGQVQVFEVDHPGTQEWKRAALAAAGIGIPVSVTLVAADLGTDSLTGALQAASFNFSQPAMVSWLGVIMYLPRPAIQSTLASLAGFAAGTQLIADYMLPQSLRDEAGDLYVSQVGPAAADRGEPWLTFLSPAEMGGLLAEYGFAATEHVQQRDAVPAQLWDRKDSLEPIRLSMIARATLSGHAVGPRCRATLSGHAVGPQHSKVAECSSNRACAQVFTTAASPWPSAGGAGPRLSRAISTAPAQTWCWPSRLTLLLPATSPLSWRGTRASPMFRPQLLTFAEIRS